MTFWKWSQTASSNGTADSSINWAEGQAPSSVNDSARAMMAAAAKYRDDVAGTKVSTGGSADAYTFTSNQSLTSLTDGFKIAFILSATNTGASTINVDSLGAKPLRTLSGTALVAGEIVSGCVYTAAYDSGNDEWLIHGGNITSRLSALVPAGSVIPYAGSSAPSGYLLCYGQAVSRTTYAALFSAISTTYGVGDNSTTFNVPDLRGRVVAGQDDMGGSSANRLTGLTDGVDGDTLGGAGGLESTTLTALHIPELTGTTNTTGAHTHTTSGTISGGGSSVDTNNGGGNITSTTSSSNGDHSHTVTVNAGTAAAHNNVQPTLILNYIIKT